MDGYGRVDMGGMGMGGYGRVCVSERGQLAWVWVGRCGCALAIRAYAQLAPPPSRGPLILHPSWGPTAHAQFLLHTQDEEAQRVLCHLLLFYVNPELKDIDVTQQCLVTFFEVRPQCVRAACLPVTGKQFA